MGANLVHQILSAFRDSFIPPVREQVGPNIEDVAKIGDTTLARASLGRGSIDEGRDRVGNTLISHAVLLMERIHH